MAIWLSSDKTHVTQWSGRDVYPLYLMFGNHTSKFRHSIRGKKLVGYLPTEYSLPKDIPKAQHPNLHAWIWHQCCAFLMYSLDKCQQQGLLVFLQLPTYIGVNLYTPNVVNPEILAQRRFFATLSTFIGDLKDLQRVCFVLKSLLR